MLRIVPLVASVEEHLAKWTSTPEDYRPKRCLSGRGASF
jgi:hypothetical protein